jgi:CubicO group peptidase (beta-lactamase class C family)
MTRRGFPGRRALLAGATVILLGSGCTDDARPADRSVATSQASVADRADRSDELLVGVLPADEPGCSAAVGIEGEVVWAGARGLADVAAGRPIETSTTFDIASVSKQFTATAVLLLAQDDRLSLNDPLSGWVADLPPWSDGVTVAQLIHHNSGIPDYTELLVNAGMAVTDRTTQRDAIEAVAAVPEPRFPPGLRFEYSSSNYVLLAQVVQQAGQQELPDFARERIFEPLDLRMTADPFGSSPDNTSESSARSYLRGPTNDRWEPAGSRWEQVGDGAVQTTPSELVRWADNYRTGRLGGDRLLDDQLADPADAGEGGYGAGIVIQREGSLWHGGAWAGYLSDFWVSKDRRTAVAVTCNGDRGPSSAARHLAPALRRVWDR